MESKKKEFSKISRRAKSLLSRKEDTDVEFKQSSSGLDASDIVAFANSSGGGAIIIGVKEEKAKNGTQTTEIVGCPIADKKKLQILDKAYSCIPPVPVELFIENIDEIAFFRLEIPSGPNKPYSTSGGTYKIREDGRVRALTPSDLLGILVEREAALFEKRFRKVSDKLVEEMRLMASDVEDINSTIESEIEKISSLLQWTEMNVDDTASDISSTKGITLKISSKLNDVEKRVISLLSSTNTPDPVKKEARNEILEGLIKQFKKKPEIIQELEKKKTKRISISGGRIDLFTEDELTALILEAAEKYAKESK